MKHRRFLSMLLTMMMVLSMFASIPFAAYAAADTVTVTDWDGLQNAIKKASSGQVIQLSADITCKKNGGDQIKVDKKTVTIDLNGHTLDRNRDKQDDDGHVIEVKNNSTLTIIDSVGGGKITGGNAKRGGGVNVSSNSTCILKGGTIHGNKAEWGGGVYAHGTFKMEGGAIADNDASGSGGGIHCGKEGTLNLTGGTISGNTSDDAGGIYNSGSESVTIKGVKIINNTSKAGGGGVNNNDGGSAELTDCEIRGNYAYGNGGGLWNQKDSTLTLENCVIETNEAGEQGGGVFTKGELTVTGGAIRSNTANGNGGGIRVWSDTTTINSGIISGNTSREGNGGGIYVGGAKLKLYGGEITGNKAAQKGGGIFEEDDREKAGISIHGAPVVKDNTAGGVPGNVQLGDFEPLYMDGAMTDGAMVYVTPGDNTGIIVSGFGEANKGQDPAQYFVPDDGYSVALNGAGQVAIVHSDWLELQAQINAAEDGATITLDRDWKGGRSDEPLTFKGKTLTLDLNGHTLNRNKDYSDQTLGNGGVIRIEDGATLTIQDSAGTGTITGGNDSDGAAILNFGTLHLAGGTITGNTGTTSIVGNLNGKVSGPATMTMTGGKITGNDGTGLYNEGNLEISGGEITDNKTDLDGGGLLIVSGGTATVTGGIISGNTAMQRNGGGIYVDYNGTLNLNGGSITGNQAAQDGGGIYIGEKGTLNVQGAPVVKDNTAGRGNNVMLLTGKVLNVTGRLSDDARLDLTAQDLSNALTKGLDGNGSLDSFTYNNNETVKPALKDGEVFVDLNATADVYVTDWEGLQKAFDNTKSGKIIALSNNISANGKGRIEVKGGKTLTLDLNGYTLDRQRQMEKRDKNGHVIEITGKSTLTVKDTRGTGVITGGDATRGGGVNIEEGSTFILESGTIRGNGAEYGGGVYVHGTFKMTGGTIAMNASSDSGGGIHVGEEGTLEITGGKIIGNRSSEDGGGIYNSGSQNVTITNATISNNQAWGKDTTETDTLVSVEIKGVKIGVSDGSQTTTHYGGGAFQNDKGGTATLTNCTITGNSAYARGGGFYNTKESTLALKNCTVTGNTADSSGGGVLNRGKLTISGGTYTGNKAGPFGGGIYVTGDDTAALSISGSLIVQDNTAGKGQNVYLSSGKAINVAGALTDGAKVSVLLEDGKGTFATGYMANNPEEHPKLYFESEDHYDLELKGTDAVFTETYVFLPTEAHPVSYQNVNSRNWMSAIPGDRTLNEINIPGTHDAAMNDPDSAESLLEDPGSSFMGAKYAKTQLRYINEQFDDGFRYVDLRLNNKYQKRHNALYEFFTIDYEDDGKNLWLVHGCDAKGGTYYAQTKDGEDTSFNQVLEWAKKFLREHPTEVIILSLRPETQWTDQWDTIWGRATKILRAMSTEINPSTNKPYLYMEDGVFGKDYTYYPKLKDVRGQIFLRVNPDRDPNGAAKMGGMHDFSMGGQYQFAKVTGGFEVSVSDKIRYVNEYYEKYGFIELPRDVATHLDKLYFVETNIVEKKVLPVAGNTPIRTPVESAADVNSVLFADGGTFDKTGYYLGWVAMIDGGTPDLAARIWKTNFIDMDMVTVTIDSGLSEADLTGGLYIENPDSGIKAIEKASEPAEAAEAAEDAEEGEVAETEIEQEGKRTFRLIKGTEITLPECLYIYDQAETGRGFQSWNAAGETTNETHMPGETFVVMEDVTFTGQWLADGETSVDVVWQDMDDADGLRADALELQVYPDEDPGHVYIQTVTAEEGWRAVLSGDVQRIVPVWEHIDAEAEGGADTAKGYRYEVKSAEAAEVTDEEEEIDLESLIPSGLVLTLVHTPQATIPASGTISWDDDENRDGLRPESVTLRLMNGEEELDSQTVTAENEWKFDFGEVAAYEDGQIVTYTLAEDEIEGYGSADTQMTAADETEEAGFTVPNVHTPKTVNMNGSVIWEDNGNAEARPQSVTVRLLANGEVVSALTVTPDGASTKLLDVPADDETEGETTEGAEAEAEANADDAAETEDATQRADNIWAWSFTGVPVYSEGSEVNYAVEQDRVPGYTTETVAQNDTWFTNIAMPATIALSFDANGGSGEMASVEVDPRHEYTLPECGFTAPEGAEFIGWLIRTEAPEQAEAEAEDETEAEAESASALNPGDVIVVSADTTVIAQWQEAEADLEEISVTVTLKVVNGAWSDGTREDKTIVLTGKAGDELRLNFEDLTEMSEPDEGYTLGDWDPQLPFYWAEEDFTYGDPITEDTTYTYTYAPIEDADTTEEAEAVSVTVTLKVVNGAWGDGTREDRIITLTGSEGDELRLQFEDIPEITAPDEGYKMGAWDPELSFYWAEDDFTYGDPITEDTTYTYTYAPIEEPAEQPASAQTWMVLFYENGGEGEMEGATVQDQGSFTLPENGYTAPEGTTFAGWLVGEEVHQPGDEVTIGEDTVIMAQWQTNEPAEQPAEGPAEQPVEEPAEQPAEEPAEEPAEQPAEEPAEQPAEEPAEQPVEEPVEQPAEKLVEQPAEEPVERPAEKPVEESAEQPAEEHTEEQPAEEPVEQPAEEPAEQPMEESAEQPAEKPASARMCTITFNSGGADGEMSAVQAADGSEYTLPDCAYYLDGCTFDVWVVESSNGGEPFGCQPGDRIIVDGDMTITAYWLWDETATENQAEEIVEPSIEYGEEEEVASDFPAEGLQIEYDDVPVEDTSAVIVDISNDDAPVETDDGSVVIDVVDDAPSEIGSVFSGAGIAAIVAAAILVIAAAGIAVARKKKR